MNANLRRLSAMGAEGFSADPESFVDLTFAYRGGMVPSGNGFVLIADGTIDLADNATSYVERTSAGVVTANGVGFSAGHLPIAIVTTVAGAITAYLDRRPASLPQGTDGLPVRGTVELVTATMLKGATTTGTMALGGSSFPVRIVVDHQCWLRFYATSADRAADVSRVITDDPTTPVLLELVLTTTLDVTLDPNWPLLNRDVPATDNLYYRITRLDQSFDVMSTYASDSPITNGNLKAHVPTNPLASGWAAWEYTATAADFVTHDFGAINALGNPSSVARTDVNFQHEAAIRLMADITRYAIDQAGTAGYLCLFVDDESISTWDNTDYLYAGVTRTSVDDVNATIVDVDPAGAPTVLDTQLTIPWVLGTTKQMWFERQGSEVVLYLSDTNFAARVEQCRATIPSRLLTVTDRRVGLTGIGNTGGSAGFGMSFDISGTPRKADAVTVDLTRVRVEDVA